MTLQCSYWHIYSDGQKIDFLFRDESEFIAGMNRIAFCILLSGVRVHAFCLMSNHIHILISGTAEAARKFISEYKRLTGIWIRKHQRSPLAGDFNISIKKVDNREYLLTTIAYIHRNPMVSGFRYRIECYPWSSASLYFTDITSSIGSETGTGDVRITVPMTSRHKMTGLQNAIHQIKEGWATAGSIGQLKMRKLLSSHIRIPWEWLVNDKGLIHPGSYTLHQPVEHMFTSQRHYLYTLSRKSELEINQSLVGDHRIMLSDSEIRTIILELAAKDFSVTRITDMGTYDRLKIASELRARYGIPIKQLGRILRVTESSLRDMI